MDEYPNGTNAVVAVLAYTGELRALNPRTSQGLSRTLEHMIWDLGAVVAALACTGEPQNQARRPGDLNPDAPVHCHGRLHRLCAARGAATTRPPAANHKPPTATAGRRVRHGGRHDPEQELDGARPDAREHDQDRDGRPQGRGGTFFLHTLTACFIYDDTSAWAWASAGPT
jgi:hypothetical protein